MNQEIQTNVAANVDTIVKIAPNKSQTLLVTIAIIGFLIIACGVYLFTLDGKDTPAYFVSAVGILFITLPLAAWFKSQSDTDLSGAKKTKLSFPDGTLIETDSRVVCKKEFVELLRDFFARKPLPSPTGVVDVNLNPVANSQLEGQLIAQQINQKVEEGNKILSDIIAKDHANLIEQPVNTAQPILEGHQTFSSNIVHPQESQL